MTTSSMMNALREEGTREEVLEQLDRVLFDKETQREEIARLQRELEAAQRERDSLAMRSLRYLGEKATATIRAEAAEARLAEMELELRLQKEAGHQQWELTQEAEAKLTEMRTALELTVRWLDGLEDPAQTEIAAVLLANWAPVARAALQEGEPA